MSQSNYKKVDKPRNNHSDASSSNIQKNEIRITAQGRSRSYISYAVGLLDPSLLQKDEATTTTTESSTQQQQQQQQYDTVVLKAMGKAIQKAVTIAEVLKRRVAGLHQNTSIESQEIEDQYEPKEEGMDVVTKKRTVSSIIIKLSKKPLDVNALGYQPPIPEDQVTAPQIISAKRVPGGMGGAGGDAGKRRKRRVRGGGRGGARAASSSGVNNQQQQQHPTKPTTNNNNNNTGNQQQSTKTSGGNQQQQGSTSQRGRGRGRGGSSRGGGSRGRGGRGQPRKPTGGNNTGAAATTNQQ